MIKINLIPVKETKRRKQLLLVAYAIALLICVLAVMGWFWWTQYQKVGFIKDKIARVDEESKGYEEKIKEVKDLEAKSASLDNYRGVIKSVYDSQKKVLAALDQLATDLGDNMRFTSIEDTADGLTVKGFSMTQSSIQQYVNRLKRPGGAVSDPKIDDLTVRQTVSGFNGKVYAFTLKMKLGGNP